MNSIPLPILIILLSLLCFGILENLFPFFTYKQSYSSRISANFAVGILNAAINAGVVTLFLKGIGSDKHWPGLFHWIPYSFITGILSFLILDIYRYGWHVLMHMWSPGWRFHRVHHTERAMNISTTYRFHVIEVVFSYIPRLCLVWLFGIAPQTIFIYDSLFVIVEVFQHCNFALPLKVDTLISYLVVTPNFHRLHHSQIVKETNSNYSSVLTIWDRLFGTYRYCSNPKALKIGLIEEPRQLNIIDLLTLPF